MNETNNHVYFLAFCKRLSMNSNVITRYSLFKLYKTINIHTVIITGNFKLLNIN